MTLENLSFTALTTAVSNLWDAAKHYVSTPEPALDVDEEISETEEAELYEQVQQEPMLKKQKSSPPIDFKRLLILGTLGLFTTTRNQAGLNFGLVTLFTGSVHAVFPAVIDLNDLNVSTGVILQGMAADDWAGYSVTDLGDVNGDGMADMMIGALYADPLLRSGAGETYILFGRNGSWPAIIDLSTLNNSTGVILQGRQAGDSAGSSVSELGDVNGDGIADMLVGANTASPLSRNGAGEAYILFGRNGSWPAIIDLNTLNASTGVILQGRAAADNAGVSVTGLGDVNGDGIVDMLVGAYYASPLSRGGAGEAYILFGRNGSWPATLDLNILNSSTGVILQGRRAGDNTGVSVSGLSDVNGDGIADIVIGAYLASPLLRSNAGEVYILFGRNGSWPAIIDLNTLTNNSLGVILQGRAQGDWTGVSVTGLGDVNGDGIADMLVGAYYADPLSRSNAGEAYILFGHNGSWPAIIDLNTLNSTTGVILQGKAAFDNAGVSVTGLGDVNGDNIADMLVGAYYAAPLSRSGAGESYILFGRTGSWPSTLDLNILNSSTGVILQGKTTDDNAGVSVRGLGDVNGDGITDMLIGANTASPLSRNGAGEVYILFGQRGFAPTSAPISPTSATTNSVLNSQSAISSLTSGSSSASMSSIAVTTTSSSNTPISSTSNSVPNPQSVTSIPSSISSPTSNPISFNIIVSSNSVVIESNTATLLTTEILTFSGNVNSDQVIYTVQGNNPDIVITINGVETNQFTQADVEGQLVEIALQGVTCQDSSTDLQLEANVANSNAPAQQVSLALVLQETTCTNARRLSAFSFRDASIGFWAQKREVRRQPAYSLRPVPIGRH